LVSQVHGSHIATSEERVANWKILVNQWRNEHSFRNELSHHLVFTKSDAEPGGCGHVWPSLVKRIKALQSKASNRAIAEAIGVAPATVDRDVQAASHEAVADQSINEITAPSHGPEPFHGKCTHNPPKRPRPARRGGPASACPYFINTN
jgi:hypothetical protein